jgi:hypothetical protein
MKKITTVLALTFIISLFSYTVSAQCKGFAKKICKLELIPYIHDGNYDAAIMSEGEEADMPKTFYAGMEYRLVVCSSDGLSSEFKVFDANKNVLYSSVDHNNSKFWDFKLESTQQLWIRITIPTLKQKKTDGEIISGCVAILIGFKDKEVR